MKRSLWPARMILLLTLLVAGCADKPVEVEKVAAEATATPTRTLTPTPAPAPVTLTFLTQNAMLVPIPGASATIPQRIPCVIDLVRGYDIVGLQEVFDNAGQGKILDAWHKEILSNKNALTSWRKKLFEDWHKGLAGKPMSLGIGDCGKVDELAKKGTAWGVKVIDARPDTSVQAALVCGPYYVMGPSKVGLLHQGEDGGLIILSKYPIIAASAFVFKDSTGLDWVANKGVVYARVQVGPSPGDYIHVFNTHLQAHTSAKDAKARGLQVVELLKFVGNVIGPKKADGHPIVFMGDFNIIADTPADWGNLGHIVKAPKGQKVNMKAALQSAEYATLKKAIAKFTTTDMKGQLTLVDLWPSKYPKLPGFTWVGEGWETSKSSPYGTLGSKLATEGSEPQRIDYFFCYEGQSNVTLKPTSIALVPDPSGPSYPLYCFDAPAKATCNTLAKGAACTLKSYTVSDHLGVEMKCVVRCPPPTKQTPTPTLTLTPSPVPPTFTPTPPPPARTSTPEAPVLGVGPAPTSSK